MTQRLAGVVPAGLLAIVFACGLAAQAGTSDDYDTFMQQDVKGRLAAFQHLSAEQKADLVRTHVTRWVDVHRSRLTDAQIQITQEWIDYATAENYREPLNKRPAAAAQLKDLELRSAAVFSRQQMGEALTIQGPHIPKR